MASLEGSLPAYMNPGRGSMPGPRTGVYFTWVLSGKDLVDGATEEYRFVAPADLRLQEITVIADVVSATAPSYTVEKGYTQGGGDDIIAANTWPASDVAETTAGSDLSFRDIDKDDYVTVLLDATAVGTVTLLAYTMLITGYYKGHFHADPADD